MTALRRSALPFDGGLDKTMQSRVRGGKGMSLAEMTALGLRVPPGFTLPSGVSRAFNQHGRLPNRIFDQIRREIETLEKETGRGLGSTVNPLLLSVRSGAEKSMPGMMDTILNVGLTPTSLDVLEAEAGPQFARDIESRFKTQWSNLIGPSIPDDPFRQLLLAIVAVLRSWNSERAIAYRKQQGISHDMGTAVTLQQMVFGNRDLRSCTGVVFSADPISGDDGLYGEFLVQAQGEDVVSGTTQTRPIIELSQWNQAVARELTDTIQTLERHFGYPVDVEFTVESGVLYILQARAVTFSPMAQIVRAVRTVETARPRSTRVDVKRRVLEELPPSLIDLAITPTLAPEVTKSKQPVAQGLTASSGVVVGVVTHTTAVAQQLAAEGVDVVLVRPDTSPNDLPAMLASKAILTGVGGPTCHAAIVARDLGIPAIVGASNLDALYEGTTVTVDGTNGRVFAGELERTIPVLSREVQLLQKWLPKHYVPTVGLRFIGDHISSATLLADLYMTDMMAGAARGTAIESEAVQLRDITHVSIAERLAAYLLLATAAEVRHYWSRDSQSESVNCQKAAAFIDFHLRGRDMPGVIGGRNHMQKRVIAFAETSASQLTPLVEHLVTLFKRTGWEEGYGGARWATIAECLLGFLKGELSPTIFSDQVFDLRHNGGELFDKHQMIYEVSGIKKLLDLKKMDGTVAALKRSCEIYRAAMTPPVLDMWQTGNKAGLW